MGAVIVDRIHQILEFLRDPGRTHFILWVGSAALLFLPDGALELLELAGFREQARPYVGPLFFVLTVLFVVVGSQWLWRRTVAGLQARRRDAARASRLENLEPDEVAVLRLLVADRANPVSLPLESAVVYALESDDVILKAASMGVREPDERNIMTNFLPYIIQLWAWDMLRARPELLGQDRMEGDSKDARQGTR